MQDRSLKPIVARAKRPTGTEKIDVVMGLTPPRQAMIGRRKGSIESAKGRRPGPDGLLFTIPSLLLSQMPVHAAQLTLVVNGLHLTPFKSKPDGLADLAEWQSGRVRDP